MQLKQQRDQGNDPGNRFHHLFLWNSKKWYVSYLNITFRLLTYSQLVFGAPSQDEGPSLARHPGSRYTAQVHRFRPLDLDLVTAMPSPFQLKLLRLQVGL
jgi:hypothetical protein